MPIPAVTCSADIVDVYGSLPKLCSLSATATNSPTSWEWTMLSVPLGSSADSGGNGNFNNGVAAVQNPQFTADVPGSYVCQAVATNATGDSAPNIDREDGQQPVVIRSQVLALAIPDAMQFEWAAYLNETLLDLETAAVAVSPHASEHNVGGGDVLAIDAAAGTGSLRTLSTTNVTACAGDDSRLSDARAPTSHASTHSDGGTDEMSIASLGASGESANKVAVTDGVDGIAMTTVAGLDSTAIHDNVNGEINAIASKATPVNADLLIIEDSAASNAKKKIALEDLAAITALVGDGPENTPATISTNNAVDVTGGDLAAGTYEVSLTTDLTDATGSTPSDFIVGVLKCDTGGGTGPSDIGDGVPIAVWGIQRIKVEVAAPRIWFRRSDQTERQCLIFITQVA